MDHKYKFCSESCKKGYESELRDGTKMNHVALASINKSVCVGTRGRDVEKQCFESLNRDKFRPVRATLEVKPFVKK